LKLICFDVDNTLSSIEGIDELARLRGSEAFARVKAMTEDAMNGKIPIESVFGGRLEAARPSKRDVAIVGARYIENVEPTARETIARMAKWGWTPVIISSGYLQTIRPLADFLNVAMVEAVGLIFTEDGGYLGFDVASPLTRAGGKREVIERLRREYQPERIVMIGDGVGDLETRPVVDLFVGFGRYATREKVKREAEAFVTSLSSVPALV
jgi:phosphoserine phosphatase